MNNDQQLFSKIQDGDKKSFELLFKTYYAPLCLFVRQYISDLDEGEEIVQGFFLKLWEDRNKIIIATTVRSYLYGAIKNRCLNYIKHQKIKQQHVSEVLNTNASEKHASNFFMEVDLMKKIEASIDSLPPRRKEIFVLSREQGLKYREIAEKLGISIKTVEAQMGQALKDLREKLKDYKQLLVSFIILFNKGK